MNRIQSHSFHPVTLRFNKDQLQAEAQRSPCSDCPFQARDGMIAAEWDALGSLLCLVLICLYCMGRLFAMCVVRKEESTADTKDEACTSLVAFPPERPSTADSPGTTARARHAQRQSDKGAADRLKASGSTTAAGLARQAKNDNVRMPKKHIRNDQPPSHHSPAASAAADVLPRIAKPSPTVPPIDDRRPSMRIRAPVREPSNTRGASGHEDKTASRGKHLSRRAHVRRPSPESSSFEEGQSALAHRNEPPPRPRGMQSLSMRSRQEGRQPADHGANESCDAAGSSLLSAALQQYYASVEASLQGASACVTDNMEQARPSLPPFHSWRDQGQLPQRRKYRDVRGDKMSSSTYSPPFHSWRDQGQLPQRRKYRDVRGDKMSSSTYSSSTYSSTLRN